MAPKRSAPKKPTRKKVIFKKTATKKQPARRRPFGSFPDDDDIVITGGPDLELLLKKSPFYSSSFPLPYELLLRIFKNVVSKSEDPISDLCSLCRVCEDWRQMIIYSPILWSRIIFSKIPVTDKNLQRIKKVIGLCPSIIDHIEEIEFSGSVSCKENKTLDFLETLMKAPGLSSVAFRDLRLQDRATLPALVPKTISRCKNLARIQITQSRILFNNQKWISDHLFENGKHLETLDLSMSLTEISSQLYRAISHEYCPNLRVLDLSTCDAVTSRTFDAVQLAKNLYNLVILRVGNITFKRVQQVPEEFCMHRLEELSMPIGTRDADRDDALLATLTFGSSCITTLDLRGACISTQALLDMPSYDVKHLCIDDICSTLRHDYPRVIKKWARSLETLSLVRIGCSTTLRQCLKALYDATGRANIRELDLSASDILAPDLRNFLDKAYKLKSIELTSCRSLPRGCKGRHIRQRNGMKALKQKLNDA